MKKITYLLCFLLFILVSCSEEADPCNPGAIVHKFPDSTNGSMHFDADLNFFYIRYSVPGTIDSSYVGYLCDSRTDFEDGIVVVFSGNFRETSIEPLTRTGGSEIFSLELDSLILM